MKITNNFTTPAFGKLYYEGKVLRTMAELDAAQDSDKKREYEEAIKKLKKVGEKRDLFLREYAENKDGKRISHKGSIHVCEIKITETGEIKVLRHLSYNKDFCQGIREALKRLNGDKNSYAAKKGTTRIARTRAIVSSPIIVDAKELDLSV